jgi:hypothetical protein
MNRARAWLSMFAILLPAAGLPATPASSQLSFSTSFAGVDTEGRSLWEGRVGQPAGGRLRLALQQVEGPEAAADTVWHVRTRWKVEPASAARSFVADMEGMVDWKAGTAHLSGVITSGWMKGTRVQGEVRFVDGDARGTLRMLKPSSKRASTSQLP